MRIGVAQINSVLGNFKANRENIAARIAEAVGKNCSLVVFPECALFGYHPFDLLEREAVVDAQLRELRVLHQQIPSGVAVVVGLITKNSSKLGRPYYNSAALLVKGKKPQFFNKTLLPTGDVFDEARFIQPGDVSKNFFVWQGKKFLLTICEDIWAWPDAKGRSPYQRNPLKDMKAPKVDLVINLSASPWYPGKMKLRERVVAATAKRFKAPVLYTNLVGGQDEIIFDGQSFLANPKGKSLFKNLAFEEHLNVFDLKTLEPWTAPKKLADLEELRKGLVLGLADFVKKSGMERVHLGMSGGIDSAVVACLAVDALGPGRVKGFALPGPFSSPESLELAQKQARNLQIQFGSMEIESALQVVLRALKKGINLDAAGVAHENLQARLRGLFLMAVSNAENSLLLTTSNKSELASGYSTLYGDMCGGLAPIGDLTKEAVYRLADYYNQQGELIPQRVIDRPPTAELKPNQKDQDSLPPYDDLDASVIRIVEKCLPAKTDSDFWLVERLVRTEFKRWQAPPTLKASAHSFGRGRRYPVASRLGL